MNLHGQNVTIVGLGRTAVALAQLLQREGAKPFVSEHGPRDRVAALAAQLDASGIAYETGGHSDAAFNEAQVIIPSPGVPPAIAPIAEARARGAAVLSELEYAWPFSKQPILAVTGTNGKTTTTELLRHLIAETGRRVVLAGNNAMPLSAAVQGPAPDYFVLEVSSYQLELVETFHAWAAAVLNVTPDHLARHGSMDAYAAIKARIFARQTPGDIAVVNEDDPLTAAMARDVAARCVPFSIKQRLDHGVWLDHTAIRYGGEAVIETADVPVPGRHNIQNAMAALAMLLGAGFPVDALRRGLRTFKGVEHRIEFVVERDGVAFYNDSKATNIDSLAVALESFARPIVLIAGGQGKGADYAVLRDTVAQRVKHLVTLGDDAPLLQSAFGDLVTTDRADNMDDAVHRAARAAAPGDVVLLSPACASFDMYANFEERGRDFKAVVHAMGQGITT